MTTNVRLSRLERVGLRDVWQNEATGFTRWLARGENQLLKSNHDHLGKIITYASGKVAK